MTPVLQMPYGVKAAEEIGPRTFRKQILKVGEIPYKGERLRFDRAYLQRAVASFNAGAMDQVPFVLADDDNQHPDTPRDKNPNGPERYRGEVKALELSGDGIDAIVELTEEGAEIVRQNPRLGVSARLVPDVERDGQIFPVVVEHVCGTLNPRVHGLRPWETVSVRSLSQSSSQTVIDLSAAEYMTPPQTPTLSDEQLEALKGLSPEERAAKVAEFVPAAPAEKDESKGPLFPNLRKLFGIKEGASEQELDDALGKFVNSDEPAGDEHNADKPNLETANLSDEARKAIDLANSDAASARTEAQTARREVAAANWKLERKEYTDAGVPPAMLDLCEPLFKDGRAQVIDLSNGEKFDAAQAIRKLLDEAKGYVDLSESKGSSEDNEDNSEKAKQRVKDAEALAEGWK